MTECDLEGRDEPMDEADDLEFLLQSTLPGYPDSTASHGHGHPPMHSLSGYRSMHTHPSMPHMQMAGGPASRPYMAPGGE